MTPKALPAEIRIKLCEKKIQVNGLVMKPNDE